MFGERESGEQLDRIEAAIAGATQSIAALTENAQARLPFYVQTQAFQPAFAVTAAGAPYTLTLQPLAQQLVRVTGFAVVAQGSVANIPGQVTFQLGNQLTLPVPTTSTTVAAGEACVLIVPVFSYMLDTLAQKLIVVTATPAASGNLAWGAVVWGEQVPATGMVS